MQPTPTPFGALVLFNIVVLGQGDGILEAQKVLLIPFAIKVGDVFTFESPDTFAAMPVSLLAYDLSEQRYVVDLDTSKTDWEGANIGDLAMIKEALTVQGWTIKSYQI